MLTDLQAHGLGACDLTDNELAKTHLRHLVGGNAPQLRNERLIRFTFPERPGALLDFRTPCAWISASRSFNTATTARTSAACWWASKRRTARARPLRTFWRAWNAWATRMWTSRITGLQAFSGLARGRLGLTPSAGGQERDSRRGALLTAGQGGSRAARSLPVTRRAGSAKCRWSHFHRQQRCSGFPAPAAVAAPERISRLSAEAGRQS